MPDEDEVKNAEERAAKIAEILKNKGAQTELPKGAIRLGQSVFGSKADRAADDLHQHEQDKKIDDSTNDTGENQPE